MLVHLFTVLSFNCAFLLTEVRKRLYHNASQLKSMVTFRREIVSRVVGYQYISQTRSIDDFYCRRSSVCPYVWMYVFVLIMYVFCAQFQEQGYALSLATNLSLSPSQRICACGNSSCPPRNPIKIGLARWLQITWYLYTAELMNPGTTSKTFIPSQ